MSCIICCDDYTEDRRKPIACPECNKEVCLSCFKRHLSNDRTLSCIFPDCNKNYSFIELRKLTDNLKFSNEIMENLASITLEEEKNNLPKRQGVAKRRKEEIEYNIRSCKRIEEKNVLYSERSKLYKEIVLKHKADPELLELEKKLKERKNKLFTERNSMLQPFTDKINIINKEDKEDRRILGIYSQKKENHYKFIKQCSHENCKGFVEDNKGEKGWKCTLCEKFTCSKCHEPLDKDHECNPDTVKNLKELKKDTKGCPKCGTGIFKIDGCDVMFCTNCQTFFSWNTGKIHTKSLHNPEAVRYMREHGRVIPREIGDDGCLDPLRDNIIYTNWLYHNKNTYFKDAKIILNTILSIIDRGNHMSEVLLPRYSVDYLEKSENHAVEYLLNNNYTEKKWKSDIKKNKKQQMFYSEITKIYNLLIEVIKNTLNNIRKLVEEKVDIKEVIYQLELIPKLFHDCKIMIEDIKICFNSKRNFTFDVARNNKYYLYTLIIN